MQTYQDTPEDQPYGDECAPCQDIVRHDEELERDIRRLQRMILAMDDFYAEIYERHCESPGFDYVHSHLSRAVGDTEELTSVLPEE